uniref:Uncharacterized protein n=1 Tax=Anguilla anguilla TaxID=7936 RepID=A0A0E9V3K8_ANGAN
MVVLERRRMLAAKKSVALCPQYNLAVGTTILLILTVCYASR